jgi:3',5'-cyclic AMP phosphodiesterase CpdA
MLIAHASDLHVGRDAATDRAARQLAVALEDEAVAVTLVTGDVTHRGRMAELGRFEACFARLRARHRVVVVPGNHDRLSEDAGARIMTGVRVDAQSWPGLHVVRLDSTAPHNRRLLSSHGLLTAADVERAVAAVEAAPEGALSVVILHHHLVKLPPDGLAERLASALGWPNAEELTLGAALLARLRGRCDLVLHGHRHVPSELVLGADTDRPLRVLNAGSTTELGRVRILSARGGRLGEDGWLELDGGDSQPVAPAWVGEAA